MKISEYKRLQDFYSKSEKKRVYTDENNSIGVCELFRNKALDTSKKTPSLKTMQRKKYFVLVRPKILSRNPIYQIPHNNSIVASKVICHIHR